MYTNVYRGWTKCYQYYLNTMFKFITVLLIPNFPIMSTQ